MPDLSAPEWVFVLTTVALGAAVQGAVGFGMNVVAAPLVVQVEPRWVPVPLLFGALTLTLLVWFRERAHLRLGELGWAFGGRVPGVLLGALAVAALSRDMLGVTLALVVLAGVVVSGAGIHVPVSRVNLLVAGVVSGFMGTSTSVGGPPMALLYQRGEGGRVRANLSAFFSLGATFSLAVLAVAGQVGAAELWLAGAAAPAVALGFAVSGWLRHHVDAGLLRPAVLALSTASAAVLLVRSLLSG